MNDAIDLVLSVSGGRGGDGGKSAAAFIFELFLFKCHLGFSDLF